MKTRKPLIALAALCLFTATLSTASAAEKLDLLPALTGAYSVGVTQTTWVDHSRAETWADTPGGQRRVTAQIWYPTPAKSESPDAPYLLSPSEFSLTDPDAKILRAFNDGSNTRSFLKAPVADGKFPVVLFNPGGAMSRMTSTFVCEELASHGYVVVAVEHYGYGKATNYPDGSPLNLGGAPNFNDPVEQKRIDDGTASADEIVAVTEKDWDKRIRETVPVALADATFVLGKIEKAASKGSFTGHLDLSKVGTMGWSQGGAESISLLVHDPRVKATVDLDGQFMSTDRDHLSTNKPFLLLHSSPARDANPNMNAADERLNAMVRGWDRFMLDHSTGPRYNAEVKDSDHGNFSDYLLFYSYKDAAAHAAAVARADVIDALTVSFFDRYLKGLDAKIPLNDPLLTGQEAHGLSARESEEAIPPASASAL